MVNPAASAHDRIGTREGPQLNTGIEGLTFERELGRGGFGVVHLAQDDAHGRQVAVKTLIGALDEGARRRFDRERRAMGTLSGHPNIGVVHTSGFDDAGQAYIVMEHLSGGSLEDRLERGPMPVSEVVDIGEALADALHTAHRSGVLHLDIKPANVLYSSFGRPKLVDFGIAAIVGDEHVTTTIRATPAFAAPEIFDGQPATEASDVYGLGATMYALLMGHPPYTTTGDESALQILRELASAPVPVADRADVPEDLRRLLGQAMAKDPAERPASMEAFQRLLAAQRVEPSAADAAAPPTPEEQFQRVRAASATTPQPSADRSPDTRGNRIGIALLGVAAVIVVIAGVVALTRGDGGTSTAPTATSTPAPTAAPTTDQAEVPTAAPTADEVASPTATPSPPPPLPTVPDITGLDETAARDALSGRGYVPVVTPHCHTVASGSVPAAGAERRVGTDVAILFDPCVVPDFVGMRLPQATALVEELVGIGIEWPNHCDDIVVGQSVAPGTVVEPFSTTVTLDLPTC